jgi:hypothetical protein
MKNVFLIIGLFLASILYSNDTDSYFVSISENIEPINSEYDLVCYYQVKTKFIEGVIFIGSRGEVIFPSVSLSSYDNNFSIFEGYTKEIAISRNLSVSEDYGSTNYDPYTERVNVLKKNNILTDDIDVECRQEI